MNFSAKNHFSPRVLSAILALITVAAVIISREPALLLEPRFWWDEGRIGYAFAYNHSLWQAFFTPHQSYFSFINNIVSVFQILLFSLEKAPLMGTYTAFIIQLFPHAVIWGGRSSYWDTPLKRAIASAIIMFNSQDCGIWLNAVTSQYHLSLVAFLLLAEEWHGRSRRCMAVYGALLFLCGITGVMSCFLMPIYLYKFYRERGQMGLVLCGALFLGCCVELAAVIWSQTVGGARNRRFTYYEGIGHFLMYYALGTVHLIFRDVPRFPMRPSGYELVLLKNAVGWMVPFMLVALASVTVYFGKTLQTRERILFIGTFYFVSLLCLLTAIVDFNIQERYFYTANVILMLMVQQSIFAPGKQNRLRRRLAAALVLSVIGVGATRFYMDYACYRPYWHKWEREVAKWRGNPDYSMRVHPIDPFHDRRVRLHPSYNIHNVP